MKKKVKTKFRGPGEWRTQAQELEGNLSAEPTPQPVAPAQEQP